MQLSSDSLLCVLNRLCEKTNQLDNVTLSHNRTAFVTGGSRGIGLGIAQALAADGWRLAINGMRPKRREDRSTRFVASPTSFTPRRHFQRRPPRACLDRIDGEFGGLNLLVNNAGIAPRVADSRSD
jgi:NAD(P)-dependent dehydrogenase (short-subunit alcohol dehydrogenase family)